MGMKIGDVSLYRYLPTLSLVRGFASQFILTTSATLFKNLGFANTMIGYMSLFALPASLKFLWAPIADCYGTKRTWALGTGFCYSFFLLAMALVLLRDPVPMPAILFCFSICALAYGMSDFASEGFFVCAVPPAERPAGVVILTAFSRLSIGLLSGVIFCAGFFSEWFHSLRLGWAVALSILGGVMLLLTIYNCFALPRPRADQPARSKGESIPWKEIFLSYMDTPRFWVVILYLVSFRFGENIIMRLSQVFYVEELNKGGLGLTLQQISLVGTVGLAAMIGGGVLSMGIIKLYGMRRTMIPLALAMILPNVLYIFLALFPSPDGIIMGVLGQSLHLSQITLILLVNVAENLGYGLGFTFYFSVVVALAHGKFRASHMAFGNALMLLGYIAPNAIAGTIQEAIGWSGLFIVAVIAFVPGFVLLFFLPPEVIDTDRTAVK